MELQKWPVTLFLSGLFLLLASCSNPSDSSQNSSGTPSPYTWDRVPGADGEDSECTSGGVTPSTGIVGGEPVLKDSWIAKGTVFIVQQFSEYGETKESICTGSLVDTNMVLTAAHCVDRARYDVGNLSVYFTHQPECEANHGNLHTKKRTVSALRIHPLWDPVSSATTNRGDIALIKISGKAPTRYQPLRLASQFVSVPGGFPILVTGFGMNNPDYYGDFGGPISLRVGTAPPISEAEKMHLRELIGAADGSAAAYEFDNLPGNEMLYIDQTQGQGICGGDSGGPSIVKNPAGEFVVTGVASFVMNPQNSGRLCAYVAAHTSVVFHKDWLERKFQEMKNSDSSLTTLFQ